MCSLLKEELPVAKKKKSPYSYIALSHPGSKLSFSTYLLPIKPSHFQTLGESGQLVVSSHLPDLQSAGGHPDE